MRDASKLGMEADGLTVIQGGIDSLGDVKLAISSVDAVVWCVGVPMKRSYGRMASLEGHKVLLKAMEECGVKRLIDWGTPSVHFEEDKSRLSL